MSQQYRNETERDAAARADEEQYVHSVYENIAQHFSRTRYKPWPGISAFFDAIPPGSVGLDAGCGNGKYLGLRSTIIKSDTSSTKDVHGTGKRKSSRDQTSRSNNVQSDGSNNIVTLGLDRSSGLVQIAHSRQHEVCIGDAINMPWREGAFDFAISIATIHHFATPSRRREAVKSMLRALNRRHGRLFIQVWAKEQDRPASQGDSTPPKVAIKKTRQMDKLELATLASALPDVSTSSDNSSQDVFVPWKLQTHEKDETGDNPDQVFQRYYHLFQEGELLQLVKEARDEVRDLGSGGNLCIAESEEWEQGNWCISARYE